MFSVYGLGCLTGLDTGLYLVYFLFGLLRAGLDGAFDDIGRSFWLVKDIFIDRDFFAKF